jgi:hypothetical protein
MKAPALVITAGSVTPEVSPMPAKGTMSQCTCETCGKAFEKHPCRVRIGKGRYCSPACFHAARKGKQDFTRFLPISPNSGTGKTIHPAGYVQVLVNGTYVMEHRLVAERILGRPLRDDEVVHHIDHNRQNNVPSNLMVMTNAEHMRLHNPKLMRWARDFDACVRCGRSDRVHDGHGLCHNCAGHLRYHATKAVIV